MNRREKICVWLFDHSRVPYAKYIKRQEAWGITREDLLQYAPDTYGYALGGFLVSHGFRMFPKLERHDAYHVITDYSTEVKDEIAMQFFFMGNGKRSLYLLFVTVVGGILFPEHAMYFLQSIRQGRAALDFSQWEVKSLLSQPLSAIKKAIFGAAGARVCVTDTSDPQLLSTINTQIQ